jgi:hypothetical protein
MERGQYPPRRKEHIANIEQTVYILLSLAGPFVGLPNPGHKEWV